MVNISLAYQGAREGHSPSERLDTRLAKHMTEDQERFQ